MTTPARTRIPRLRRALVATALLGVVASGMLVAAPAIAAPDAPTITSPAGAVNTVGPDLTVSGDLAVPAGYDYLRVQWRQGATVVEECFQMLAPGEETFSCTSSVPAPGVYTVVAQHSDVAEPGEGDWSNDSNAVTVTVGGTSAALFTNFTSFSNEWQTLLPTLSGTGPALGTVRVVMRYNPGDGSGEQSADYCVAVPVALDGTWSCVPPANPLAGWGQYVYFEVYGTDLVGAPTSMGYDDEIGGDLVPPPPSTVITPGPASIGLTASGVTGSFMYSELYQVTQPPGDEYLYGFPVADCEPGGDLTLLDCSYTALEPGIWNLYTSQDVSEVSTRYLDEYVLIPEPVGGFSARVGDDRSAVFSGTGTPGQRAIVRLASGGDVCSVIVSGSGSWQCTANRPVGTASYRALQQSVGFVATPPGESVADSSHDGFSALSSARSLTIPPPPAPASVPPVPQPTPSPIAWTLLGYDGSPLQPGQILSLSAEGLPPGTTVDVEIRSTPQLLGSTVASDDGAFALDVTVPADLPPGQHTLVATATPPGGAASVVSIPVEVVPALAPAEEAVEEVAETGEEPTAVGGSPGQGGAVRADPAAPSAITESIPTLQRIFDDPWVVLASGGLALAILLLVAFPAELLNSTLSSNTGRLGRWFVALEKRTEQVTDWFSRVSGTRAIAAAVLVALTSVVFGFVDPEYGFDPVSLRMTVSLAIGLFLITYVAAWISGAIARRTWGVETEVTLQPVALLFAVLGVVVARVLEFSPGFLIGLVIGLDLISRVDAAVRARVVILSTGVVVGVAVAAWFAFSAFTALSSGQPGWVELLISDALVATTAEGLTAALASLLPLGFLAGHEVFRHSRPMWIAAFVSVGALFALIVLPTAAGETAAVSDIGFWMLVMVIFAVVTLSLWAVLQFTGRDRRDGEGDQALPVSSGTTGGSHSTR